MFKIPQTRKAAGMTPASAPPHGGASAALPPAMAAPPAALSGVDVSSRIAIAAVAAAMGMLLLFGAGFANSQALHEAAHDARHGIGFPCH